VRDCRRGRPPHGWRCDERSGLREKGSGVTPTITTRSRAGVQPRFFAVVLWCYGESKCRSVRGENRGELTSCGICQTARYGEVSRPSTASADVSLVPFFTHTAHFARLTADEPHTQPLGQKPQCPRIADARVPRLVGTEPPAQKRNTFPKKNREILQSQAQRPFSLVRPCSPNRYRWFPNGIDFAFRTLLVWMLAGIAGCCG